MFCVRKWLVCLISFAICCGSSILVNTDLGLVLGQTDHEAGYDTFLGIPYGIVHPENPFGPSSPHPQYEKTLEANDDSVLCPQREEYNNTVTGTLSCLHVHVFTPPNAAGSDRRLPVMVYLFGGEMARGIPGRYIHDPRFLVRHDVIFVSVNFRVGAYGFICLRHPSIPGNAAFKDQVLALRWINRNIAAFGGDPNKVTLFGSSSGALMVDFHILSPMSVGLFHGAIIQSGSIFMDLGWPQKPSESGLRALAAEFGYNSESLWYTIKLLASLKPESIVTAQEHVSIKFLPCLETAFEGIESFLTVSPEKLLTSEAYHSLPVMIGASSTEALVFFKKFNSIYDYLKFVLKRIDKLLIHNPYLNRVKYSNEVVRCILNSYFGDAVDSEYTLEQITSLHSDLTVMYPTERSLSLHLHAAAVTGNSSVYSYVFGYSGHRNFMKARNNVTLPGAAHSDELGYLFAQQLALFSKEISSQDKLMMDRLTTMWTNFAKYRDPTPGASSSLLPIKWPPSIPHSQRYMWIDETMEIRRSPFNNNKHFWDLLYALLDTRQSV